jgi:hypothetical protein
MAKKTTSGAVADLVSGKPPAKDIATAKVPERARRLDYTAVEARERLSEEGME